MESMNSINDLNSIKIINELKIINKLKLSMNINNYSVPVGRCDLLLMLHIQRHLGSSFMIKSSVFIFLLEPFQDFPEFLSKFVKSYINDMASTSLLSKVFS
jgi:hypothetical protein